MPIPRAKGPGLGRTVEAGGLKGDWVTASDSWKGGAMLKDPFNPEANRFTGRLHGVSGMFLLKPDGSSALRFFFEISPVDINAAGRGLTNL
jgi:hypothetical protein